MIARIVVRSDDVFMDWHNYLFQGHVSWTVIEACHELRVRRLRLGLRVL